MWMVRCLPLLLLLLVKVVDDDNEEEVVASSFADRRAKGNERSNKQALYMVVGVTVVLRRKDAKT